jgi:hypothetical protein
LLPFNNNNKIKARKCQAFYAYSTLFHEANEGFTSKIATSIDETCKVIEIGFEYVCEMDGKKLFRKRK